MIRVALAVVAGYLVTLLLVIGGQIVLEGTDLIMMNLLLAFPYGFGGGWLTAKIARGHEINAGLFLGLLAAAMGAVTYYLRPEAGPLWYWTSITASLTAGAVFGAYKKFVSVQRSAPRKKSKKR